MAQKTSTSLRILWHSCSPTGRGGYGIVTKYIACNLGDLFPIVVSCYYGMPQHTTVKLNGVPILPTSMADFGRFSVMHYMDKFQINLPILHTDFWPFPWFSKLPNSMVYGPIDNDDFNSIDIKTMKDFSHFVPCSNFSKQVYEKITGKKVDDMIPHGVNTSVFKSYPKLQCRKEFKFSKKKFIFGMVGANSDHEPRKGWDDLFIALHTFAEEFPQEKQNWVAFCYTNPFDEKGYDLGAVAKYLGLGYNVYFPEHLPLMVGLEELQMAKLYNTFDLFLNASRREGFCLPILEAQACGVPVVCPDITAMPELVKGHGWISKKGDLVFTPRGWASHKADREDLAKKIEDAYFNQSQRKEFGIKAQQFAQQYNWELLLNEKWIPLLERLNLLCSKGLNKISSSS
jgi:glycosyltransferase involved in cell wall biosynthesis